MNFWELIICIVVSKQVAQTFRQTLPVIGGNCLTNGLIWIFEERIELATRNHIKTLCDQYYYNY